MRGLFAAALASALTITSIGSAVAAPRHRLPGFHGGGFHGGEFRGGGFRGGGLQEDGTRPGFAGGSRFEGGYGGGGRGYRHRGYGAAVGAGVAGLAAGALIGGALASQDQYYDDPGFAAAPLVPADGDGDAYCVQRFKSYDPASGTYLGYDGLRHPCPEA